MGRNGAEFVMREFRWECGARTLLSVTSTIAHRLSSGGRAP
jgi:hypothetical protein